jgi:hypothetical protein
LKVFITYILILNRYFRVRATSAFPGRISKAREKIVNSYYKEIFESNIDIPGINFNPTTNTPWFSQDYWIYALLSKEFLDDEIGIVLHNALLDVQDWSFHSNWSDEIFRRSPEVEKVYQYFKKDFSFNGIETVIKSDNNSVNGFILRGHKPKFIVQSNDDSNYQKLETQVLSLRRREQFLSQELHQREEKILKLEKEIENLKTNIDVEKKV